MPPTLLTPSELDAMSPMNPEIAALIAHNPPLPLKSTSPEAVIHELRDRYKILPLTAPRPEVTESLSTYRSRDDTSLRLCIYAPASSPSSSDQALLPVIVWYHGGGGCLGAPEMLAPMFRSWVQQHSCLVIAPQYRLGPESKFPTGQQDAWDALAHIALHATALGGDLRLGFLVGGESAGAVMSGVLALEARKKRLEPPLTGVFLAAGSYFNPDAVPEEFQARYRSRRDPVCVESPLLNPVSKAAFNACLAPDYASPEYRAALWASHEDLPRTYVQTCGNDINRDDGILYAEVLRRAGVEVRLDVYAGGPHCFWFAYGGTGLGRRWRGETRVGIEWLLRREETRVGGKL